MSVEGDGGRSSTHSVKPLSTGARSVVLLAALLVVAAVLHVLWLEHYRRGLPLDIDESGYIGFALDDLRGWHAGALRGFFDAALTQRATAPLLPMAAAPVLGLFGHEPYIGMTAQLPFLAVLLIAVFGLGCELRDRTTGLLAATVVAMAPGIIDFTHTFQFALPATAFFAATTYALVRSRTLTHTIWAVVAGASLGLMLLARTYTVAFLPGFVVAAAVLLLAAPRAQRWRTLLNTALGGVAFLVVTAWWYVPNRRFVLDYLTGYGYGAKSAQYSGGTAPGLLEPGYWTARLEQILSQGLYIPIGMTLAVAMIWALVSTAARQKSWSGFPTRRSVLVSCRDFSASPLGVILICTAAGYVALSSSQNEGYGFTLPLVPMVVVVGVDALMSLSRRWRLLLGVILLVGCVGGALAKGSIGPFVAYRCLDVPGASCLTVTNGSGPGMSGSDPDAARRGPPGQWVRASERGADVLYARAQALGLEAGLTFFASRDPLFNTNSVGLHWRLDHDTTLPIGQLVPDDGGNTEWNYFKKLARLEFGQPLFLFTTDRGAQEYRPRVRQPLAEQAARCLGFQITASFRLPDGRQTRLYQRMTPPAADSDRRSLRALFDSC